MNIDLKNGGWFFLDGSPDSCEAWPRFCARIEHKGTEYLVPQDAIEVLLDGQAVKYCEAADEEQGIVRVAALNAQGKPYLDSDNNLVMETRTGRVQLFVYGKPLADWPAELLARPVEFTVEH